MANKDLVSAKDLDWQLSELDMTWKNGGFAFNNQEQIWFLRIDEHNGTVFPLKQLNFKLHKSNMPI